MSCGILVKPEELEAIASEMHASNERVFGGIRRDIRARREQNNFLDGDKSRREGRIYNHIFTEVGRSGLTTLLDSFSESYNMRSEHGATLNKARDLENLIPSSLADKFQCRVHPNLLGVLASDTRWFVGGE